MKTKVFFINFILIFLSLGMRGQTTIPGDSLVYGPMFSPTYNNSVRAWVLTKNNTGSGNTLSLSMTSATAPTTELSGVVFNSDDRLGYSLRSYEFTGLTPGASYNAKLMVNGTASTRMASITNGNQIIDDFEFLSGGCGRIYDLSRCIDQPESEFHVNGNPEMFNVMANEGSDLMVWLGDATYLLGLQHAMGQCPDGVDDWANKDMAFDRYMFYRSYHDSLTMAMPQLAITDNHDTGPNEFNKTMPTLGDMKEIFMDWWPNPEYKSTSEGQGLFSSYTYKDVEYFLTDNRSFRDGTSQHFGPEQLAWLKQALLTSTATFKVIINGTPTFTPVGGRNFSVSTQAAELFDFVQDNNINGVLSFSADIHEQRFMVRDADTKYPLYDVLSGNINSDVGNGSYNIQYDSNNLIQGIKHTYLRVNVYGDVNDRRMKVEYVDANGEAYFEEIIHEDMLTSQNADAFKLGLKFQNNITDASEFNHSVNATNFSFANDRNDEANEAMVFTANTTVNIANTNALNLHNRPFSLTFWVNPSTIAASGATILSNGETGAGVSFGISAQGKLTYTDHATNTTKESNYSILPNSWSYITWKYDNVKRKLGLYYNGFLIQNWTNVVSPLASDATLTLGNNFQNKPFIGKLDDVSLYGRLISDEDILAEADIETNRGGVLKVSASQMAIPGEVINPVLAGDFTIEFWGKLNSDPGTNNKILASNGRINGNSTGLSFEFPDSNKLNVVVGTNASGWNTISEQGEAWNVGEWNHIALVASATNSTLQYYQNGNLIGTSTYAGYVPNSWGLGFGYSPSYNSPVQAELDDIRIWHRTLTADEIKAHRNHSLVGNETDLSVYYDFTTLPEEDTTVTSQGTVTHAIPLSGGQVVTATSPIGNIAVDFQEQVSGKWSKNNEVNNHGLSFPTAITTYNANIVVGKKADTALEAVPGLGGKFYANGGWKIDPLNSPFATVKINLTEALTTASDSIATIAGQYYLLKKDQETQEFTVVTDGAFDGSSVTFYNANLEEGTYFLSWEESEFVPGRGGALALASGHDVRIHYTPVEIIMGGAHTFELWVNVPEDPNDKTILSNHGRVNNNTSGFTLEIESNNTLTAVYGKNNNDWTKVSTIDPIQMGEWNHIAVTATPGGEVKIYLNGVLKQTAAFAGYVPNNTWDFAFGKSMNYGGQVQYKADEFRMWSEARTQEEIVADMHRILETTDENLRFYYTFDQDDSGTFENLGNNVAEVTYTNASILAASSPVAKVNVDFDDVVSGSWSITNEVSSGMYVDQSIDSYTQNVVFGRSQNNTLLELPNTTEETFYVVGGWQVNALNMTSANIAVNLVAVFENVDMVNATVADYLLIKGDPQSTYEVVASGATAIDGIVTFSAVPLTVGNYYLAYEIDNEAAIAVQGGALDLQAGHAAVVPKEGVNAALSNAFTIELWGRLNATAGGNTKLVGFTNTGGGEFGWEMEFLNNQTLQTITGKGSAGGWNTLNSTHVWNIGAWNHVAVTFVPNGDFKFYVNGELVDSMPVGTFQPCINGLAFGKNITNNSPTAASLDEFRIWTIAKTQEEIQRDMHLTINDVTPSLAYNYTFNQDNSGYLVNLGSTPVEVAYTNAQIIPATGPIRNMEAPFRNKVKGSWSVKNDADNGMFAANVITDNHSNLVIGREVGEEVLAVLGSTTTDTLYLNSRYKIDPLFIASGSLKVDLSKVFGSLNQANLIANEYFLLTGTPATEVTVLASGTKENNTVTFENITFDGTPVYLAWKNINEYPIGTFPITAGNLWKYNDTGVDLGTNWKTSTYDDATWVFGNGILGYGDGVESTPLSYGPDANNKYPTYYFRNIFNVEDASQYGNLLFKVMKDDGVVVYVNGTEAFRMNMPEGAITYNTFASSTTGGSDEGFWNEIATSNLLVDGENVIAVELHQAEATSSDLRFDMQVNFQLPAIAASEYPLTKDQEWYYFDKGTSLDAAPWTTAAYDNLTWNRGFAPLGYGDTVNTTISYGNNSSNKYITSYYAKDINVATADLTDMVEFGLRRDDGAIVYVNGVEVFRNNMPTTPVDYLTTASSTVDGINENIYFITTVPKTVFTEGVNRIAVELHQASATSSDTRFDLYIKNSMDLFTDCTDEHIGCFTSIQPTGQTNNLIIPEEHDFQLIFKQGSPYTIGGGNVPGNHDYTAYVPTNGSSEVGRLSVNHENTPGGVSIVNLHLNTTELLWNIDDSKAVDLYNTALVTTTRNCSGGTTPWGTVVTAEESTNSGDVNGDGYEDVGWLVEIDPITAMVKDYGNGQEKLWAMGRMNHENVVISADGTTAYYGEDGGTHCMYKYVMDVPGNLQAGTVYVLKLDLELSGNDPSSSTAQWIEVPNDTKSDRNNLNNLAAALGGTNFNGVEDCEISPLDGKVYFAAKGRNRVYRFKDEGTTVSEFETFVGGRSYDITSSTGTVSEPWGDGNDNLVFDDKGNMWVCEDGGNNYIWVVRPDHSQSNPNVLIFASMPSGSEPTGLTFTPDYKYGFFSVQHPSGSNAAQEDATTNNVTFNASATVVFSLEDYLGAENLSVNPITLDSKMTVYPNPTTGILNLILNSNHSNEKVKVTVYDLLGRNLMQLDGLQSNGSNQIQLDLTSLVRGNQALFLQVEVGNVTERFKVLTTN